MSLIVLVKQCHPVCQPVGCNLRASEGAPVIWGAIPRVIKVWQVAADAAAAEASPAKAGHRTLLASLVRSLSADCRAAWDLDGAQSTHCLYYRRPNMWHTADFLLGHFNIIQRKAPLSPTSQAHQLTRGRCP